MPLSETREASPLREPSDRLIELRARFDVISRNLPIQMQLRGGSGGVIPAGDRPDIDFTVIASSPDGTAQLAIESSAIWTKRGRERRIPIERTATAAHQTIILEYAGTTMDPSYLEAVSELCSSEAFLRIQDRSLTAAKRAAMTKEHVLPMIDSFLGENEERLMEGLVRGMVDAFGRVINAGFHSGNVRKP